MRHRPIVYLVGADFDQQSGLIAALEAAGLHLQTFPSAENFTLQYKGDEFGCLLLDWRPGDSSCAQLLKKLTDSRSCLPALGILVVALFADECEVLKLWPERFEDSS